MKESNSLRKVQLLELEIAKEMKRICETNNIKYFLLWGSLLGAVRHEGFIPWDDDMDFGMLREDYEKFIDVCKKELDPKFFMQTWDTDSDYPFAYAKIRIKGTHFREQFSDNCLSNDGIFIDVFPMDNAPNTYIKKKVQEIKYFLCIRLLWIKKGMGKSIEQESAIQKIKYVSFLALSKVFSFDRIKNYFKKVLNKYNNKSTKKIVCTAGKYCFKYTMPREWAENLTNIKFETIELPAFKSRHEYLSLLYGDYMTPPPLEERYGHLPSEIDFGPY